MSGPDRRAFLRTATAVLAGTCAPRAISRSHAAPAAATLRAQRLAWAGVRLQVGNATLFLDPLADSGVWGPALKDPIVPLDVGEGPRFVLVTHLHPDHFDVPTIQKLLGKSGSLLCPPAAAASAASRGLRVRTAPLYEPQLLGDDFTVTAVPASDGYGDPQVSWVVSGGGRRIIHGGDTMWHGSWWHVGRQLGPFDAAFLPINGARFSWRQPAATDIAAVMTPDQAVAASIILGARLLVPIHYGVVGAQGYQEVSDPVGTLLAVAKKRSLAVEVARPGEWLTWQARR